jgi:hypothetical protein
MTHDEIRAACEADLRSHQGEGRSPKKASGIQPMKDKPQNPIGGLFKNLNQDARNALAVAAIGGAAAGVITDYMAYRRSYSSSLGYWLSNSWDEAVFFAICGF